MLVFFSADITEPSSSFSRHPICETPTTREEICQIPSISREEICVTTTQSREEICITPTTSRSKCKY